MLLNVYVTQEISKILLILTDRSRVFIILDYAYQFSVVSSTICFSHIFVPYHSIVHLKPQLSPSYLTIFSNLIPFFTLAPVLRDFILAV